MKRFICLFVVIVFLSMTFSCQESLEDRAERQAKEYTHKYCPTPARNFIRTDSLVFDRNRKVYLYYISFTDKLDDQDIVDQNEDKLRNLLQQSVRESASLKTFVEAGYRFDYVCHSDSDPDLVLAKFSI